MSLKLKLYVKIFLKIIYIEYILYSEGCGHLFRLRPVIKSGSGSNPAKFLKDKTSYLHTSLCFQNPLNFLQICFYKEPWWW